MTRPELTVIDSFKGLILTVVIIVAFFSIGLMIKGFETIEVIKIIIGIVSLYYVYFQFEFKKIILSKDTIKISYPLSFFLREQKIKLDSVVKIKIVSTGSAYSTDLLFFYFDSGKKRKFHFLGNDEYQKLINKLRERGIEVEVDSDDWK